MNHDRKKHQKEVERRKRSEDKTRSLEKTKALQRLKAAYPEIVFTGEAEPEFEKLIREAIARLPLHSQEIPDWERRVYRKIKSDGYLAAIQLLAELDVIAARSGALPVDLQFHCSLGHSTFLRCGEPLKTYLKKNDVWFRYGDGLIEAHFRKLDVERTPHGRVHISPLRPQAIIGDKRYTVGYSSHAMDQIARRVHPTWEQYAGHGEVFALFHDVTHFVPCGIKGDNGSAQPAVAMFQSYLPSQIRRGITSQAFVAHLTKDDGTGLYILIGYLPVGLSDGIATAKTYLRPGWCKTPEYSSYFNRELPRDVAERLREIGTEEHPGGAFLHSHPQLLRFFHENGFPQTRCGSDPCFSHVSSDVPS